MRSGYHLHGKERSSTWHSLVAQGGSANEGARRRTGSVCGRRRWESRLAGFSQLQPVAVRIVEHRYIAGVLEHLRLELHAARFQLLERLPAIARLDGVRRRDAAVYRLGLPGVPGQRTSSKS